MDWMRHHRAIDQIDLNALPFGQHERRDMWPKLTVHRPRIRLHVPAESDRVDDIRGTSRQRLYWRKLGFERVVECRPGMRAV